MGDCSRCKRFESIMEREEQRFDKMKVTTVGEADSESSAVGWAKVISMCENLLFHIIT